MRVGVACERLPGGETASSLDTLEGAAALGLDGVAFPSSRAVSADLVADELAEVAKHAAELGLFLEVGLGRIAGATGPERPDELAARFDGAVRAGATELTGYTTLDRFDAERAFSVQLDELTETMRTLAGLADQYDVHVNLESHEDLSSYDVLEVLDRVGSDRVGVNLDLANLVVRGEDPHEGTRRLAPYVRQTQLEDITFSLTDRGLHRHLAACGAGIIDWSVVVGLLVEAGACQSLCVEQHRGQFDLGLFDPAWIAAHPALPAAEPLWLLGRSISAGTTAQTGDVARTRSDDDLVSDLATSAQHLRDVVAQGSR